jgi:hypothetical protein
VPGRAPVPVQEVKVLKALALGACALFLLVTPAAAHVSSTRQSSLEGQLRQHVRSLRHDKQVIRFFQSHRWLLSDPRFQREAKRELASHRRHLAVAQRRLAATRAAIVKRQRARRLAGVQLASPEVVICRVFGPYCREAIAVSRCETGGTFDVWARNGQYLGLFQMGTSERRLFGHGPSAVAQARAAHRYFVASGRDWSPWSCKPWW